MATYFDHTNRIDILHSWRISNKTLSNKVIMNSAEIGKIPLQFSRRNQLAKPNI